MYSEKQLAEIDSGLKNVINESMKVYMDNFKEPSLDEFAQVRKDILNYIKEKKLVIYGGYAQNKLISVKNKADQFYNEYSCADIEVYSDKPIEDAMRMGDMLFEKKYKHVEVKEGVHHETYKIFCNFENYADVSYIEKNILDNMPVIEIEGIKFAHPHFMTVDAFRVYTDMLVSNWRLEKTLTRFNVLMKHYPFDLSKKYNVKIKAIKEDISSYIKKNIIHNSDLVVIGQHAFNYLAKKVINEKESKELILNDGYFEVVCKNLKEDSNNIISILKKKYPKTSYTRYYKFFQFFDERIDVFIDKNLVMKIYGNNERCITYKYSEKKLTKYATFQLLILYLLAGFIQSYVKKDKVGEENCMSMITAIYKLRNRFFIENKVTIFEESPFQEFVINCIGLPYDQMRKSFEEGAKKKEKGKRMKFGYRPSGNPGKAPSFVFKNHSGEEIK